MSITADCPYCGTRRIVRKDGRFMRHHRFVGQPRADAGICPGSHPFEAFGGYCPTCNGSCLVWFANPRGGSSDVNH